ncbi:MAG: sensor histidine kinase [Acidimicrobiales bacterium]
MREERFWVVQAMVVVIAAAHLLVDLNVPTESGAFPSGLPVALLILPVGYAALRYGLAGSAATGLWATLLWLPDLLLPGDRGHAGGDIVDLALVDAVAFFFGQRIEAERLAHVRVERATAERLAVEAGYRQLFEANGAPILVLGGTGLVREANPAAVTLFGGRVLGRDMAELLGEEMPSGELAGRVVHLADERDYRIELVALTPGGGEDAAQLMLEDVTQERSERRRATRYAALVVQAEEDQRRRLARELHDEPLQLFLHLARHLETLADAAGVPPAVAYRLGEARSQALDAASRLRVLARDLRPPALDQLGLVPALSSLLADIEEETELVTVLVVSGRQSRLSPDLELGAFRIVQESARNTLRHAAALQLSVTVEFGADEITLCASDDGKGFALEEVDELEGGHLGLLGMAERASLLGGHLDLRSSPGLGTVVRAVLPLS